MFDWHYVIMSNDKHHSILVIQGGSAIMLMQNVQLTSLLHMLWVLLSLLCDTVRVCVPDCMCL